jgi:hypothetical protein
LILIKTEKCGHCFYCIYRDIIEYRDNFLDNNREMIFLISPNPRYSNFFQKSTQLFYLSNAVMTNAGVQRTVPDRNTLVIIVSNIA